jgi:hypothetical protein
VLPTQAVLTTTRTSTGAQLHSLLVKSLARDSFISTLFPFTPDLQCGRCRLASNTAWENFTMATLLFRSRVTSSIRNIVIRSGTPISAPRLIHVSSASSANPISHPAAPGPPPPAPSVPESNEPLERIQRKREKATLLAEAQKVRAKETPKAPLKKRFWKDVTIKSSPG